MKNIRLSKFKKAALMLTTAGMLAVPAYSYAMNDGEQASDCQKMQEHKGKRFKGKHSQHKQLKKMARYLDLTAEQKSEIKDIFTAAKSNRNVEKQAMNDFKLEVKALVQADTFDEQAFKNLHSAHQVQIQNVALEKAKVKHQIFNVLTPEQQEKWLEFKEKRANKMAKRNVSES